MLHPTIQVRKDSYLSKYAPLGKYDDYDAEDFEDVEDDSEFDDLADLDEQM